VICVDKPECGHAPIKLLVPLCFTGKLLAKTVCEKAPWAEKGALMVGGVPLPHDASMAELDKKHMAADGFLYVTISTGHMAGMASSPTGKGSKRIPKPFPEAAPETEGDRNLLGTGTSSAPLDMFHLPDKDPDDSPSVVKEIGTCEYKGLSRLMKKNPDRVPIRCRQLSSPNLGLPSFDKKLLAPRNMLFSEFKDVIHNYVPRPKDTNAQLFVEGVALGIDAQMSELYEEYKAEDGLLYMAYGNAVTLETQNDKVDEQEEGSLQQKVLAELEVIRLSSEAELEQVRVASVKEVAGLHAELERTNSQLASAQEAASKLQSGIAEKEAELEKVQKTAECLVTDLQTKLEFMTAKCEESMMEVHILRQQASQSQAELLEVKASSATEVADLKARLQNMESELQSSRSGTEEVDEVADLKSQLASAISERDSARETAERALQQCSGNEKEQEVKLMRAIEGSANRFTEIKALKAHSQKADCEFKETIMERDLQLEQVRKESANRLNEIASLQAQLHQLKRLDDDDWLDVGSGELVPASEQ